MEKKEIVILAEKSLIGTILLYSAGNHSEAIDCVRGIVAPDDFHDFFFKFPHNTHARIYQAMLLCPYPDQLRVAESMNRTRTLASDVINGVTHSDIAYMSELIGECPCAMDYEFYARAVHEYGLKRKIYLANQKGDFKRVEDLTKQKTPQFTGGIRL